MLPLLTPKQIDLLVDGYALYDEETQYAAIGCNKIFPEGTIIRGKDALQVHPDVAKRLIKKRNAYYTDQAILCNVQERFRAKGWLTPYDAAMLRAKAATFKRHALVAYALAAFATTALALALVP